MFSNNYFLLLIIFSFALSKLNSSPDFKEIDFMKEIDFKINANEAAYFKYKLKGKEYPIGLRFLLANLYTVNVYI